MKVWGRVVDRARAESIFVRAYMAVALLLLGIALVRYMVATFHWPLVFDTQEMLYINFLIKHGMAPYRDLTDINMPGVYLFHAIAASVFGPSDIDWRICEFSLDFVLIGSMTLIARPYGRLTGPLAGVLFILLHATHGPGNAVQRDEIMTVLAVAGYAALFESLRRRWPWLAVVFGFLVGFAMTIKPSVAPLAVLALAAAAWGARKQGLRVMPYLLYGLGGLAAGLATSIVYLWYFHAFHDFLVITRTLIPAYLGSNAPTWGAMFVKLMQWPLKDFFLLAALAGLVRLVERRRRGLTSSATEQWEILAIFCGVLVGLASYLLQHKGFAYHAYPFYAFLLLWAGLAISRSLAAPGLARWIAIAALSYGVLRSAPLYLHLAEAIPRHDRYSTVLAADLRQLNTVRLDRQVQCMDVVLGCMTALYHDNIVQYSGFTGDLLLFVPVETPVVAYYRNLFLQRVEAAPPAVFVVSNQRWAAGESFTKLEAWPAFKGYLEQNYILTTQRQFIGDTEPPVSPVGSDTNSMAYRIYIHKGSPLLVDAPRTPAQ